MKEQKEESKVKQTSTNHMGELPESTPEPEHTAEIDPFDAIAFEQAEHMDTLRAPSTQHAEVITDMQSPGTAALGGGAELSKIVDHSKKIKPEHAVGVQTLRKRAYKARAVAQQYGGADVRWAKNSPIAKRYWDSETIGKPRWAVVALVWLRTGGVCWVCTEHVGADVNVFRLSKESHWHEYNCVGVCDNCAKVWIKDKDFVTGAVVGLDTRSVDEALRKLKLSIMNRRNGKVGVSRGARPLTEHSSKEWLRLFKQERRYKDRQRAVGKQVIKKMHEQQVDERELLSKITA